MANYLEKYQYQQIAPAQTNIDQIAKTFAMKVGYWEQGAAQVKAAYQNNLGLELTLESNQKVLEAHMKTAKDQLQKVSNTDLSIGANVTDAIGVFDPITNDKALMADHALTSFYKQQFQTIEAAKKEDDGKFYSQYNEAYVKQQYQQFANETDRNNWKAHKDKRKAYEPYHNYADEQQKILDNCAPNSLTETSPTGMYLSTYGDSGLSSIKLQNCLEAGLSSKARRQIEIEGAVTYGNDAVTLGQEYVKEFTGQGLLNNRAKANLAIEMDKALKVGGARGTELAAAIKAQMDNLDTQTSNGQKMIEKIQANNYQAISDNYESVAGQVYSKKQANQFADAFAYEKIKKDLVADNVQMLNARQTFEASEAVKERQFQMAKSMLGDMNALEREYIKAGKAYKKNPDGSVVLDPSSLSIPLNQALTEGSVSNSDGEALHNQAVQTAHTEKIALFRKTAATMLDLPTIQNYLNPNSPTTIVKDGKITLEDGQVVTPEDVKRDPSLMIKTPIYQTYINKIKSGESIDDAPDDLKPVLIQFREQYTKVNNRLYDLDLTDQLIDKKLATMGYDVNKNKRLTQSIKNDFVNINQTFTDQQTGKTLTVNGNNIDQARYETLNCENYGYQGADRRCDKYLIVGKEKVFLGRQDMLAVGDNDPISAYNNRKNAVNQSYVQERNKLMTQSMYNFYQQNSIINDPEALNTESVQNISNILDVGIKETSKFKLNNIVTDKVGTAYIDIVAIPKAFEGKSTEGKEEDLQKQLTKQGVTGAIVTPTDLPGHYRIQLSNFTQPRDAAVFNTPKADNKYKQQVNSLNTYKELYGTEMKPFDHHDLPYGTPDGKSGVIRMRKTDDGGFIYLPMTLDASGNLVTLNETTVNGVMGIERNTPEEAAAILEKQAILNQRSKK